LAGSRRSFSLVGNAAVVIMYMPICNCAPPPKQSRWGIMFKADMQGGCKVSCSMMLMMTVLAV
jgi:hypothetical protein